MNKTQRNAESDNAQDSHPPTPIEDTEQDEPEAGSKRARAPRQQKGKSLKRGWRASSAPTKLMVILTAIICGANLLYAVFAAWQLWKIDDQIELSAQQTDAMKKQLAVMEQTLRDSQASSAETSKHNTGMLDANKKLAEAAKLQAEGISKTVEVGRITARAAEKSASLAQAALANERPSIGAIASQMMKIDAGKPMTIVMRFMNTGRLPARNVTTSTRMVVLTTSDRDTCPPIPPEGTESSMASRSTIAINGYKDVFYTDPRIKVSERDIQGISSRKIQIYIYGRVDYIGMTDAPKYFTSFYGRYNPDLNAFDECPHGNDAK